MSIPNKKADYISPHGTVFWFDEMLYHGNLFGTKRLFIGQDGLLRGSHSKSGILKPHVQEAYNAWAKKTSETILLTGDTPDELESKET